MLKLSGRAAVQIDRAAAFRRLCVETSTARSAVISVSPAAFRRLCVETILCSKSFSTARQPPSGGCVLKQRDIAMKEAGERSRLQAAVC